MKQSSPTSGTTIVPSPSDVLQPVNRPGPHLEEESGNEPTRELEGRFSPANSALADSSPCDTRLAEDNVSTARSVAVDAEKHSADKDVDMIPLPAPSGPRTPERDSRASHQTPTSAHRSSSRHHHFTSDRDDRHYSAESSRHSHVEPHLSRSDRRDRDRHRSRHHRRSTSLESRQSQHVEDRRSSTYDEQYQQGRDHPDHPSRQLQKSLGEIRQQSAVEQDALVYNSDRRPSAQRDHWQHDRAEGGSHQSGQRATR